MHFECQSLWYHNLSPNAYRERGRRADRKGCDAMGYAVETGETARTAFERILEEELQIIRRELDGIALQNPDAVHNYRRHLKKARSLARMARHAFPGGDMREIGRDLGAATRIFAAWREREALQESLEWLVKAEKGEAEVVLLKRILAALKDRLTEGPKDLVRESAVEDAKELLEQVIASVRCQCIGSGDPPVSIFCRGAGCGYRQARKAMKRACADPDPQVLHEWRKHAKHLRHHVQILSTAWPACFGALESELHRLTDVLGNVHDLALLREFLLATPPDSLETRQIACTTKIIEKTVRSETERAFGLGALLFAEKSRVFRKRINQYVVAWESGSGDHDAL